ncbi:hypothetical protein V6N11_016881 [Hibiscus sabdariffa]|uniref:Uncharacterized protein n=1 Tax=Hibiscus sabdariffa TaxID=183260 RepID=A0ABR2TWJ0_9ROSI
MNIVLKVWKRLTVTFFSIFVVFFFYRVATVIVMLIWAISVGPVQIVGLTIRSIWVPNHDKEQEPDQRQGMVNHIHISYPSSGDEVQLDHIRMVGGKRMHHKNVVEEEGVFK